MENIDYQNTRFTFHKMIPENGNELTALWGVKIVENYANAYGIIGTAIMNSYDAFIINLGLTKSFNLPPKCYVYVKSDSNGIVSNQISNPFYAPYNNLGLSNLGYKVIHMIRDDNLILINSYNSPRTAYFRIHGV